MNRCDRQKVNGEVRDQVPFWKNRRGPVGQQLYRRLPQAFVVEVLEAFNDQRMTEKQPCALLGLSAPGCMAFDGSGSGSERPGC